MATSARRTTMFALFGLLGSVEAAPAATVADTMAKWGLLGTWQLDCAAPPSDDAVRETYVVRGGRVFEDRDGGNWKDSSPVLSAAIAADNTMAIVIKFDASQRARENVFAKSGNRKRAIVSRFVGTNDYSIRDGAFVHSGAPSVWLTRCY